MAQRPWTVAAPYVLYNGVRFDLSEQDDAATIQDHLNRYERLLTALGELNPQLGPSRPDWLMTLLDNLDQFYSARWATLEDPEAVREALSDVRALARELQAVAQEIGKELARADHA